MLSIFQFKIVLKDTKPPIWRRIQVPATYTFWNLHCAIQNAMGWSDYHLHAFDIWPKGTDARQFTRIELPHPDWDSDNNIDERKERIADWFPSHVKQCAYMYDFGDGWDHSIIFERKAFREKGTSYPRCITGKNACPPEDCGGTPGYARMVWAFNHPQSREAKEIREWLGLAKGERFDPSTFDPKNVFFEDPKIVFKRYSEMGMLD